MAKQNTESWWRIEEEEEKEVEVEGEEQKQVILENSKQLMLCGREQADRRQHSGVSM